MTKTLQIIITLFIISLTNITVFGQNSHINAEKGKADITSIDFNAQIILLNGEWEFYPNKLYTPKDFSNKKTIEPIFIKIPSLWNQKENISIFNSGQGFGTYRITLKTENKKELLAINLNRVQSAYKLWINNKFIAEKGLVGVNKYMMKPHWSSANYSFLKENNSVEIILQVSNFYHKKGGIENNIKLSTPENINNSTQNIMNFDILLLGAILIMGLYHLELFLLRKKDISSLFFSLTMIFSATFTLTTGEIIFSAIFPHAPWEILLKTNYISNYARLIFFMLFLRSIFPQQYNNKPVTAVIYVGFLMIIFVTFTPAILYTKTLIVFLLTTALGLILILIGIIKATIKKLHGAKYSLFGIIILLITAANDFLLEFQMLETISMATIGFFVFVFLQSYMLSMKTSAKYLEIKKITDQLLILGKIKDGFLSSDYSEINKPFEIIKDVVKADRTVLLLKENENWILSADLNGKMNTEFTQTNPFENENQIIPSRFITEKAYNTKQSILLERKKNDEKDIGYLSKNNITNAYIMPVKENENVSAILILENKKQENIFNENTIKTLQIIESQIYTFVDTYKLYTQIKEINESLERKVIVRTKEIVEQNNELEIQRTEIEQKNNNLNTAYSEMKQKNKEVEDSINYARKIQNSILPDSKSIKRLFPSSFILYKPKDILSGDFYWADSFIHQNKEIIYFTVADCTGHGVPGSLMSIVGNNLLYDTIKNDHIFDTDQILNSLQTKISKRLNRDMAGINFNDTIDMVLIAYYIDEKIIRFSAARNSLIHISDNIFTEYKGEKKSVGEANKKIQQNIEGFSSYSIKIKAGDKIYLFTDGFIDQIGGQHDRKFMKNNFFELIQQTAKQPFENQLSTLSKKLLSWQGTNRQTDDILIAGIEFKY